MRNVSMTTRDVPMKAFGQEFVVPKGTRVTKQAAGNQVLSDGTWFVDDLSWIPPLEDGIPNKCLIHDATYYGIRIPDEYVS